MNLLNQFPVVVSKSGILWKIIRFDGRENGTNQCKISIEKNEFNEKASPVSKKINEAFSKNNDMMVHCFFSHCVNRKYPKKSSRKMRSNYWSSCSVFWGRRKNMEFISSLFRLSSRAKIIYTKLIWYFSCSIDHEQLLFFQHIWTFDFYTMCCKANTT